VLTSRTMHVAALRASTRNSVASVVGSVSAAGAHCSS